MNETFSCREISRGIVEGEVLLSQDQILFYHADPATGELGDGLHDTVAVPFPTQGQQNIKHLLGQGFQPFSGHALTFLYVEYRYNHTIPIFDISQAKKRSRSRLPVCSV